MSYKILFKRFSDKKIETFFENQENTKQFLIDLKELSFGVLHGKILKGKIEDIELLQIYDINYDYDDPKRGPVYNVGVFNGDIGPNHEYVSAFSYSHDFYPEEKDITRDLLIKYYRTNEYKNEDKVSIKKVIYDSNIKKIFFDDMPFDMSSSSSYITIARMFFDNGGEEIGLGEITSDFTGNSDDLEKKMKSARGYIHHFNRIIEKEFNISELIRVEEKVLHNTFPVILKVSE